MHLEQGAEQGQGEPVSAAYREKRIQIFQRNPGAVAETLNNEAMRLQSTYRNYLDYEMFYVLAGDTPPTSCTQLDFPGKDSVMIFFERLDKEFPRGPQN